MVKKPATLLAALALAVPGMVLAEASDFNLVELQYLQGDVQSLDIDGWSIGGSLELSEEFFALASYRDYDLDEDIAGLDSADGEDFRLGAGYIFGQNDRGNFYGTLEYVQAEVSASAGGFGISMDEDGYALGLGTRFNLGTQAEIRLKADYLDVGGSDMEYNAAFIYDFTDQFAGVIDYRNQDEADIVGLGVRFYF